MDDKNKNEPQTSDLNTKFQNNESEIKACDKSDNISIDANDLFKEINFSSHEKKHKGSSLESPIIRPINKFEVFHNFKSKGPSAFQQGFYFNEKKTPRFNEKPLFSPHRKIVNNYNTIKLSNNININVNNYYNIYTSKPESKLTSNLFPNNNYDGYFNNNQLRSLKQSNNMGSNKILSTKINNMFDQLNINKHVNTSVNSKFNNFGTKNKLNNKVNFLMNSEMSVASNTNNNNDDYFLSLFSNVNKKNKNIQLIAERVKKMSQKNTSKHSLIYNLNNNYKLNQDYNVTPKRNIKDRLKELISHRQLDNKILLDLDAIENKNETDNSDFDIPFTNKVEKNNHSTEEFASLYNEERLLSSNHSKP